MQHLIDIFKHSDMWQKMGTVSTAFFGILSFNTINAIMQFIFLIVSIALGIVTILHTQEKRKALRKGMKDEE